MTPWGDSDSLRDRRLHPGPGTSPEDVAENHRERLFGAMVATVAQKGYADTRVADLVEISGISTRSFYNLFENKQACFVATLEAVQSDLIPALSEAGSDDVEWGERLPSAAATFADLIAAQPATARLIINDAYAAGPSAWRVLDRSQAAFEELASPSGWRLKRRDYLPSELVTAQVGAALEVTRSRLREGAPEDLHAAFSELVTWMRGYPLPPEPLRLATRPPTFGPESTEAHDDYERALRAFAVAVADRGYAAATVHEAARLGSMSPATFYANFRDKHDALLAAIDSIMAQLTLVARTALGRSSTWARGVRAAIGSMLNLLASRPAMAHLLTVEIFAGGDEAMRQRHRAAQPLVTSLAEDLVPAPTVPVIAAEAIAGGVAALIRKRLLEEGPHSLPALAPFCTYFVVAPVLGAEDACEAANGDGRLRQGGGSSFNK